MITGADFKSVLDKAKDEIIKEAIDYMTNYSKSEGEVERNQFTKNVLTMLEVLTPMSFNRTGSFTDDGANQAINDEVKWGGDNYQLTMQIVYRLRQLEEGEIDFEWLEKSWATKWRPMLYKAGHKNLATNISREVSSGISTEKAPERPYVSSAFHDTAPFLGDEIDKLLLDNLPIRRV